jgi:hypothetical protein
MTLNTILNALNNLPENERKVVKKHLDNLSLSEYEKRKLSAKNLSKISAKFNKRFK